LPKNNNFPEDLQKVKIKRNGKPSKNRISYG